MRWRIFHEHLTETSRELSEGCSLVRSSFRHARLFINSIFSCSPVNSDCWMFNSSARIAFASSMVNPRPLSRNLVFTVCKVSTPLSLKFISELMLASSLLSLWTLARAWWTSDLSRSGSYFVLEVELVEFKLVVEFDRADNVVFRCWNSSWARLSLACLMLT